MQIVNIILYEDLLQPEYIHTYRPYCNNTRVHICPVHTL